MPSARQQLAKSFASRAPGTTFNNSLRKQFRRDAKEAGFGIAEILLIIQTLTLLWQIWELWKDREPGFNPVTNTVRDPGFARYFDSVNGNDYVD
jgi:hypothetical protein